MKTLNFKFYEKELAFLRKVLRDHILDLRIDEITYLRVGLSTSATRKDLLLIDSILSKLNNI